MILEGWIWRRFWAESQNRPKFGNPAKSDFLSPIRLVRQRGLSPAIVADGSQGPALTAQAGSLLLASRTGLPVMPVGWAADRYWSFRSWDRTAMPKPFSRVVVEFGEPFEVPKGVDSEALEEYRLQLERRLLEIYRRCWGRFGRETH